MGKKTQTCMLDYLPGTLATAYRGLVTSLVIKDFCITEEAGASVLNGTLLSMPPGEYEMALIQRGTVFTRGEMKDGYFELGVPSAVLEAAPNLQLDVLQRGTHIGTFLLKREGRSGVYSSALELSEELKWLDLKTLGDMLRDRKGLQRAGESVIASAVSSKKDWRKLSDDIQRFSKDLFWYERPAHAMWFEFLSRFSLMAAFHAAETFGDKTVANALDLIELPLREETDVSRRKHLAGIWLKEAHAAPANLSYRYGQALGVVALMHERASGVNVRPLMRGLLQGLREARVPALRDPLAGMLKDFVSEGDADALDRCSEGRRKAVEAALVQAESALEKKGGLSAALEVVEGIEKGMFDESAALDCLLGVLVGNLKKIPPWLVARSLKEFRRLAGEASEEAEKAVMSGVSSFIRRAINEGVSGAAGRMLMVIAEGKERLKDIVLNGGTARAVMESGDEELMKKYGEVLRAIRVPPPSISGFSDETWAELANPLHLKRLSGFMEVLEEGGPDEVLVHLISCLYISGVFIPDDRLFQREVSAYLNSGAMGGDFLLNYLLLKKLPVYFNEVGASGRVRDYTTELDSWGNDPVIYFLRKQVHVNASSNNIPLMEAVIRSWVLNEPRRLKGVVPEEVYENIDAELMGRYSGVIRPLFESMGVLEDGRLRLDALAGLDEGELRGRISSLGAPEEIGSKIRNLCLAYGEVKRKYALSVQSRGDVRSPGVELASYVEELKKLKRTVLSPEKTSPKESLYFKRHIAFGIPSVVGTYSEPKFDAYGRGLRVQEAARVLLEGVVLRVEEDAERFAWRDLEDWIAVLEQVKELFGLNGLENAQVGRTVAVLRVGGLYHSQVTDLLRVLQRELTWWAESFYRTFYGPVMHALGLYPEAELPERLRRLGAEKESAKDSFHEKAVDVLVRDIINSVAGFEEMDRLLNSMVKTINLRVESGRDERSPPRRKIGTEREFHVLDELDAPGALRLGPLLGSKAGNLVYLMEKGIPVPPAVVFPSSRTPEYARYTESAGFGESLQAAVRTIEERAGLSYGRERDPLFLSVRSGSYLSMPGILESVLYCGINFATCEAFAKRTGNPWLAWDSYRRFIEHYSSVVLGVDRAVLEDVLSRAVKSRGARDPRGLEHDAMKEVVEGYLSLLSRSGLSIPGDPHEQLKESARAVYRSWYGRRAVEFRSATGVSEHWGTAVTVMQMIYANDRDSGSSVFFTRDPFTLERGVYGETKESATGDDLVGGKARGGRPLSKRQGGAAGTSMEETEPALFSAHEELARKVEEAMGGLPQEVEAAYRKQEGVIYILQTKRMELRRGRSEKFHDVCRMESNRIGRGIGVHGGALSGVATLVTTPGEVREVKRRFNEPVILIRKETSTDDVALLPEVDGILTAVGGASSHAAILAQKFDLSAVVGCPELGIFAGKEGPYAMVGEYKIEEGTPLSIDGANGLVYSGMCAFMAGDEARNGEA